MNEAISRLEKNQEQVMMHEITMYIKSIINKRQLVPLREEITKFLLLSEQYAVKFHEELDILSVIKFMSAFMRYETPEKLSPEFQRIVNAKID